MRAMVASTLSQSISIIMQSVIAECSTMRLNDADKPLYGAPALEKGARTALTTAWLQSGFDLSSGVV